MPMHLNSRRVLTFNNIFINNKNILKYRTNTEFYNFYEC